MSFFLVFVAVVLAAVAIFLGTDLVPRLFRRGRGIGRPIDDGFDEPVASLPPVLLPAEADAADIDRIRFAVGVRGYRMDQVDQVLDELREQITRKDRELADLRAGLGHGPGPAPSDAPDPAP
ncbi:MAG TPA: DivIVA domain-containing protein [Arthrobacter sp.]|nr:DivIVA domain-containing protein [Arthrobacter sp.]